MGHAIFSKLHCPDCLMILTSNQSVLTCPQCCKSYLVKNNVVYFYHASESVVKKEADNLISQLKNYFKKYSWFYNILYYAFGGLFIGLSAQKVLREFGPDKLVLNLGAGTKRLRPDVINVDFHLLPSVDIVADIRHLPFANNSVDAVVNEFVLEHAPDPGVIIQEMERILKPGGLVYLTLPFIEGFHSSPHDYYRWTLSGLQTAMQNFEHLKSGIRSGPTSALTSVLVEWLSLLFCFGLRPLEQLWLIFFTIVFSPLKLLDRFMCRLPNAANISYAFYYLGRKKYEE